MSQSYGRARNRYRRRGRSCGGATPPAGRQVAVDQQPRELRSGRAARLRRFGLERRPCRLRPPATRCRSTTSPAISSASVSTVLVDLRGSISLTVIGLRAESDTRRLVLFRAEDPGSSVASRPRYAGRDQGAGRLRRPCERRRGPRAGRGAPRRRRRRVGAPGSSTPMRSRTAVAAAVRPRATTAASRGASTPSPGGRPGDDRRARSSRGRRSAPTTPASQARLRRRARADARRSQRRRGCAS